MLEFEFKIAIQCVSPGGTEILRGGPRLSRLSDSDQANEASRLTNGCSLMTCEC